MKIGKNKREKQYGDQEFHFVFISQGMHKEQNTWTTHGNKKIIYDDHTKYIMRSSVCNNQFL